MTAIRDPIRASTRLVALLGHPVDHSRSPQVHNAAFSEQGLDLVYLAFDVRPKDLAAAVGGLRALGVAGANVTVPHKEAVVPLLDEVHELAARIGAVNTVVNRGGSLVGYNTDVPGFLAALEAVWGRGAGGTTALVLGAGGAARSVVAALQSAGAKDIYLWNRTEARAGALCEEATTWGSARCRVVHAVERDALVAAVDLVVNATTMGMGATVKEMPVAVDNLSERQAVLDLAYGAATTPLLAAAAERGACTIDGLEMLVQQAARSYELWTERPAPLDVMRQGVMQS